MIQIKSFVRLYHITAQQTVAEPSAFVHGEYTFPFILESPAALFVTGFLFLYHLNTAYLLELRLVLSIAHQARVTILVTRH
jgi:hypothetical protein